MATLIDLASGVDTDIDTYHRSLMFDFYDYVIYILLHTYSYIAHILTLMRLLLLIRPLLRIVVFVV